MCFNPCQPCHAWSKGITPLKTCIIFNPRSGGANRALPVLRAYAQQHQARLRPTAHPRHAGRLAAQALAEGFELVVAAGGDGTMNEVAAVITDTAATLGLVPCGSGDGLGRHLGIHGPVPRALGILTTGAPRLIDTGLADGHPFFNLAGIGFEAVLADRFNRLRRRGLLRYLLTAIRTLATSQAEDYTLIHDSERVRLRAFTLAVANASQYGNNARVAPHARLDDGLLDLCAIPPLSPLNVIPLTARMFTGTFHRAAGVVFQRSGRFVVERAAPGPLHTDGEVHHAGTRVEFQVRPASLRLLCPAGS